MMNALRCSNADPQRAIRRALIIAAVAMIHGMPSPAMAAEENYPTKAVRIVVPFAPGGSTDSAARSIAQRLGEAWGKPVIVENKPGAGGVVGTEYVSKSAPDGYTILMGTVAHAAAENLYANLPYRLGRDFKGVTEVATSPMVLVVSESFPAKSVSELIEMARANPGKINYASAGAGTASHMSSELFKATAKIDLTNVAYKSSGLALNDVIAGHVPVMFDALFTSLPHIKGGKLRALGVASATRSPIAPEIPTIAERGLPGFESTVWFGFFVPAQTPPGVIAKLNRDTVAILKTEAIKELFLGQGLQAVGSTQAEFDARVLGEIDKWGKVIRSNGIKVE